MIHSVINPSISDHVSEDTVREVERVILSHSNVRSSNGEHGSARLLGALAWRLYEYLASKPNSPIRRSLSLTIKGEYFAVLMGLRFRKCMPYFVFSKRKHLYMFDAWPQYHDKIKEFVRLYDVSSLFITSRQATERLQRNCPCPVHWIPEGIDPSCYRHYDYQNKDIDIMEFGRRHLPYHEAVRDFLAERGRVHLYEKEQGELIFSTREAFIDGLARSKISICISSNITHPERAQNIETMTVRYLQSMLAKCLIVGHAPSEMVDLFGYSPVVEIDQQDPAGQLIDLLSHHVDFIPLIERNYNEVLQNHTWIKRWKKINSLLSKNNSTSIT